MRSDKQKFDQNHKEMLSHAWIQNESKVFIIFRINNSIVFKKLWFTDDDVMFPYNGSLYQLQNKCKLTC